MVKERRVRKVWSRRPTKDQLSVRRRAYGITPNDVVRRNRLQHMMVKVARVIEVIPKMQHMNERQQREKKVVLQRIFAFLVYKWKKLVAVPQELHSPLSRIKRRYPMINSFSNELIHGLFRFDSRTQLIHLLRAFRFPQRFEGTSGHIFSGEEILLAGLFRLHAPNVQGDISWRAVFGFDQPTTSMACSIFFGFMVENWAYLLQDNLAFWKPYLPEFAELIRAKVESKGVFFPPGSFRVFGFTDNTMNATCRPGGGPTRTGEDAPRGDPLIQRAWYNGWKKLHGMKWQTIDLPNGMNMHVWGPVSIRHNDIWTLEESCLLFSFYYSYNLIYQLFPLFPPSPHLFPVSPPRCEQMSELSEKLALLQRDEVLTYCIYGDSAYVCVRNEWIQCRHTLYADEPWEVRVEKHAENLALSSCREVIEWDYGDVGTFFSYVDYKKRLQMRKSNIGMQYLTAMIMRNAMVCMRGCNTSKYFNYDFPDDFLYTWTGAGPRLPVFDML